MHPCMHPCMAAWRHKAGDHNWLWLWLEPIRDSTQSQSVWGGDGIPPPFIQGVTTRDDDKWAIACLASNKHAFRLARIPPTHAFTFNPSLLILKKNIKVR